MHTISFSAKAKTKSSIVGLLVPFMLLYFISWLVVYMELGLAPRLALLLIFFIFSLKSFRDSYFVMLMLLFFPFFHEFFRDIGIGGVTPARILFLPFFYISLKKASVRKLQIDGHMLVIILLSILSLKLSADILYRIQDVPLSTGQTEQKGFKNFIAFSYDVFVVLSFLYFTFTKLSLEDISELFKVLLFFVILEAVTLLFLVYQNPQIVLEYSAMRSTVGYKSYLWRNPYFGHKNDWGMMLSFMLLAGIIKKAASEKDQFPYLIFIVILVGAIAISLSRQAYVWTTLGVIMVVVGTKNFKVLKYAIIIVAVVAITRPQFIMDRVGSMVSARTVDDFKNLNRKVGDLATAQFADNLQVLPRMFFTSWEYNWSEGFWNGMLHQLGIFGLLFNVYIYLYLLYRYWSLYKSKNKKLRFYGLLGLILISLMFFANFNRRSTHFMHYNGTFTQINLIVMFLVLYIELVYYSFRKRLKYFHKL